MVAQLLHKELSKLAGYEGLSENAFPTLPVLEATEFGQQHFITTFCLGPPPSTLLAPAGEPYPPAVTLHVIFPEGYAYWQPETGTGQYAGGVPAFDDLPTPHRQVAAERTAQLAAHAAAAYPDAPLDRYLRLLEQVATTGWLLGHNPSPAAEKAVALQLQPLLRQLCEPEWASYYRARGRVLSEWIARVTYEQHWVEQAIEAVGATAPAWASPAPEEGWEAKVAAPIPAVLDNRQCVVVALYHVAKTAAAEEQGRRVYPPFAACYVAYPDFEVRWRELDEAAAVGYAILPRDEQGRSYLGVGPVEILPQSEESEARRLHQQTVAAVLERGWLASRHRPAAAEQEAAQTLRRCAETLFAPPLSAYYEHTAWQLLGWQRRVLSSE